MKTNQFRAMVFAPLMAVISLATVSAQAITVSGTVTDAKMELRLSAVRYR